MQETLQIPRFHAECCKTQVLGPYHGRGGGGVVANREPGSYIYILYTYINTASPWLMWVGIPDQAQPAVDAKVQSLPPGLSRGWLFEDVRRHFPSRRISDSLLDYTTRLYIMMSEVLNNTLKSEIWIHSELWKACDDIHSFIQCFAGLSSVILLQGFQFHATEHAHTQRVTQLHKAQFELAALTARSLHPHNQTHLDSSAFLGGKRSGESTSAQGSSQGVRMSMGRAFHVIMLTAAIVRPCGMVFDVCL